MVLQRQSTLPGLISDAGRREGGRGGGMEVGGEGDYIPIATLSPHGISDFCMTWAAMGAIFVSVSS